MNFSQHDLMTGHRSFLPAILTCWAMAACIAWGEMSTAQAPGEEIGLLSLLTTGEVPFEDPNDRSLRGRVGIHEVSLMAPLASFPIDNVTFAAGAWAGWTRLAFSGHPDIEAEDLYGIAAMLAVSQSSTSGWSWSALAMPGYNTDFRKGRTGEGKVILHGIAEYPMNARWRLLLGAAYDTAFGEPQIYPVGGVDWRASETLRLRLAFPAPAVYWAPAKNAGVFAILQPAGDRWIVNDDDAGEQVFLIESWRAGLGMEHRLFGALWLRASGGMDFGRRYEVRSGERSLLDEEVDDTWYASLALVVY